MFEARKQRLLAEEFLQAAGDSVLRELSLNSDGSAANRAYIPRVHDLQNRCTWGIVGNLPCEPKLGTLESLGTRAVHGRRSLPVEISQKRQLPGVLPSADIARLLLRAQQFSGQFDRRFCSASIAHLISSSPSANYTTQAAEAFAKQMERLGGGEVREVLLWDKRLRVSVTTAGEQKTLTLTTEPIRLRPMWG